MAMCGADPLQCLLMATGNGASGTYTKVIAQAGISTRGDYQTGQLTGNLLLAALGGAATAGTDALDAAGSLASRVDELQGALDPIAQNSRTSAVLSTEEGTDILASGGRDLSPAQRALANEGDILARSPGAHAEIWA